MGVYNAEIGCWMISTHSDAQYIWLTDRSAVEPKTVRLQRDTAAALGRALTEAAVFEEGESNADDR